MITPLAGTLGSIHTEADMSWIREAGPSDGDGAGAASQSKPPPVISVMSINPTAMKAVADLGQALTFGASALTRVQEEAIATAVSVINKCRY